MQTQRTAGLLFLARAAPSLARQSQSDHAPTLRLHDAMCEADSAGLDCGRLSRSHRLCALPHPYACFQDAAASPHWREHNQSTSECSPCEIASCCNACASHHTLRHASLPQRRHRDADYDDARWPRLSNLDARMRSACDEELRRTSLHTQLLSKLRPFSSLTPIRRAQGALASPGDGRVWVLCRS